MNTEKPNAPTDAFALLDEVDRQAAARTVGEVIDTAVIQPIERSLMRARLAARVRDAAQVRSNVTIAHDAGQWEKFSPRVHIKILRHDPQSTSYLLKLEAGAVIWPHRHRQDEECIVLEGAVKIGNATMNAGTFHLAPAGHNHEPITSETGAVLYLRGAMPHARDLAPLDSIKAFFRGIR